MTHDELLAKINDTIEISRWLDRGIAEGAITLKQAQIYWFNTNALQTIVRLHKPVEIDRIDMPMCQHCEWNSYPCHTIEAIEKELA